MRLTVTRKATHRFLLAASLLLSVAPVAETQQSLPPQLAKIAETFECRRIQESMPAWKRERTEPIKGSQGVLNEHWSACGRNVSLSIIWHASEAGAVEMMKSGASPRPLKRMENLGDEAYTSEFSGQITFRKGNLVVFVSTNSYVEDFFVGLDQTERNQLRHAEEVALTKGFARFVDRVLTNPAAACQPLDIYQGGRSD